MDARESTFGSSIVDVVLNDIFDGADVCVVQICEVFHNVVVEIYCYVGVFGFIWISAGSPVIPIPAIRRDDSLPVGEFGSVYDGGTGCFYLGNKI